MKVKERPKLVAIKTKETKTNSLPCKLAFELNTQVMIH